MAACSTCGYKLELRPQVYNILYRLHLYVEQRRTPGSAAPGAEPVEHAPKRQSINQIRMRTALIDGLVTKRGPRLQWRIQPA